MPSNVTSLLQELVRIPSVNPDNAPGTDQTGEAEMAHYVQAYLEALGYQVVLEEIRPGRPNLIARAPGADNRPRILLGPHLDTVGVGGMTIDPFAAELRDGKIHGRGASDTKGPMAAMLQALTNCQTLLESHPIAIDFVAFMGEESSQWGSKHFAKHYADDYEFALVGEPTSLDIVYTTKGSLWATLQTSGKAAHSSQPELGDNAILKLTSCLDRLNRKFNARLASYTHPVLGHSTLNIGVIRGGSRPNIVPDSACAEIDIRLTPSLHQEGGALTLLEKFIAENKLPLEVTEPHENPPMELSSDNLWIQKMITANPDSNPVGAPWFSDAAHLNDAGIASVCIGPGSIDQAHTKNEYIKVSDLEAGVEDIRTILVIRPGPDFSSNSLIINT